MKSKQINRQETGLIRIDRLLLYELKIEAAKQGRTIRSLVEEYLADVFDTQRQNS